MDPQPEHREYWKGDAEKGQLAKPLVVPPGSLRGALGLLCSLLENYWEAMLLRTSEGRREEGMIG